ncbi:MAG TPA: phosphatase PAP2 family protein [Sediminibacterium sp.]|nr:phosphatase PAP2 family protein [Sediminibacterium sp.]
MNFINRCFASVIWLCLFCMITLGLAAQGKPVVSDSSRQPEGRKILTPSFKRSLVLPAAMIGYGIIALNDGTFSDWNEDLQRKIHAPMGATTHIDDYLQYLPALASHVLSLAGVKPRHRLFDRLVIDGITASIATTSVFLVKRISHETRPDLSDSYSFPSGHAATAFASAELLRMEYKDASPWIGISGYAVAFATGYLRMYNNKHWLGDVVAGAGIGILSARIATQFYPLVNRLVFKRKNNPTACLIPTLQQGGFGLQLVKTFP